jgi:beta-galactosidase
MCDVAAARSLAGWPRMSVFFPFNVLVPGLCLGAWLSAATLARAAQPAAAAAQPTGQEWEQEQNLALNKEPACAAFASFADTKSALKILPEHSRYWRSLDGRWKFNWVKHPDERPKDFFQPGFDVSNWKEIAVPSSWQCQGYDVPVYSNQRYLFKRDWPNVMGEPPKNYTAFTNRNPVGSYRRDFEVPADWAGREVFIRFDGVDSFFYLWINGRYVGFSKDSRTPAAFNITRFLQPGRNVVAAEVYRFSDGSYLECQDMWRLSGIFRSVSLQARPATRIRDFFALPDLDAQYRDGVLNITGDVYGPDAATSQVLATLYDSEGRKVVSQAATGSASNFAVPLGARNPLKWTAETPNLYTLVLELKNKSGQSQEFVSAQVGFRKVEIKNEVFLVNGQPVKLKGVNRHENFPETGHALSRAQMELDMMRLKQANVNHVRTSHYPNDPYWYYLCNRDGIYILDEANIESHGYYYGKDSLSHPKEWEPAHVARVMAMVERDKNQPCVVIWSLGNEAGPGRNFVAAEKALKARDTSRPTQYERNNDIVDMGSNQYPDVGWVWHAARGGRGIKYPFYISEYAHIMNNALGNLADYWEAIESSDKVMGAAIWEWCDQGLYKTNANGERFVAYGGDFGDAPNDGQFIVKGVVFADRTPKPCYFEVKQVYQNIAVTAAEAASGKVEIFNKHFFKDLSEFDLAWELSEDGKVIQSGKMPTPKVGPRQKNVVSVPFTKPAFKPGAEYFVKLGFRLRAAHPWAPKGYELAAGQVAIPNPLPAKPVLAAHGSALQVDETAAALTVRGTNFTARFDLLTGSLARYAFHGEEMLTSGIELNAFRCPVNNDGWAMGKWFDQGLRRLSHRSSDFKVEHLGETVRLTATVLSKGENSERCVEFGGNHTRVEQGSALDDRALQFRSQLAWTVYPDGSIAFQTAIMPNGPIIALPKLGVRMELPERLANVTYFGRGPEENYPDRKTGSFLAQYSRTVRDMFVPYARPNDMANREEVRWLALTDAKGAGVLFSALDQPMSAAALPYSANELLLANHPPELPKPGRTVLTLDAAVLGLGGASCGPGPIERDIPKSNHAYHLGFVMRPVDSRADLAAAARVSTPQVAPVAIMRQKNQVTLTVPTPQATIRFQRNDAPTAAASGPIAVHPGDRIIAWAEREGFAPSARTTFQVPAQTDKARYSIKYVSSQQRDEGEAEHLIDGDPDTYWHTEYGLTLTKHPHTVDIDLGEAKSFKAVAYLPRQDNPNGRVAQYRFATSDDGKSWATVAEGGFPNGAARQIVALGRTVTARYLRFSALSEVNGQDFASAAEIDIVP